MRKLLQKWWRRDSVGLLLLRLFVLCFAIISVSVAQPDSAKVWSSSFGVSAGMGVSLINATDVVDYINVQYLANPRVDDFGNAVEFFGGLSTQLSEAWGLKAEYSYLYNSISVLPGYNFSYGVHMPMGIVHYLTAGPGFVFKFGGGVGYYISSFSEDLQLGLTQDYVSRGVGAKVELEGNTAFDDHLYGYIAADFRKSFMSAFEDNSGNYLVIPDQKSVTMNFFTLGLKFGLAWYL